MPNASLVFREDKSFRPADKLYWHDKVLAATLLKFVPKRIRPNHLTALRFILTPFVMLLVMYGNYAVGLAAFLIVASLDILDGSLARVRHQITEWGSTYDPLADKILIGSMVFTIVLRYLDLWTALVIILLEVIIIATAWYRRQHGALIQANIFGKIKMSLQVTGVTVLLLAIVLNWEALFPFAHGTFYLAIAFAVVSLLSYGI